jgi:hypothetical protein
MKIAVKLLGARMLTDALTRGGSSAVPVLTSTLRESSLLMFRESQRITPHAEGVLRASGVVRPPKVDGKKVTVELGYGGAASKYALRQHEDLSLNHPDPANPNSDPAGQAKYLEDPVREGIPELRAMLKERLKGVVR